MHNIIEKGGLVFDIGAHHGESIDKFQRHHGAGRVVSVEACFENYVELKRNIAQQKYNAVAIHAAAWHKPDIINIAFSPSQSGLSTTCPDKWKTFYTWEKFNGLTAVPAITLDMLRARFGTPVYIKVDVEGAEYDVLRGMSFKVPYLTFEFHGAFPNDTVRCLRRLSELGYTLGTWVEDDVVLTLEPDMPLGGVEAKFLAGPPRWGNITVK